MADLPESKEGEILLNWSDLFVYVLTVMFTFGSLVTAWFQPNQEDEVATPFADEDQRILADELQQTLVANCEDIAEFEKQNMLSHSSSVPNPAGSSHVVMEKTLGGSPAHGGGVECSAAGSVFSEDAHITTEDAPGKNSASSVNQTHTSSSCDTIGVCTLSACEEATGATRSLSRHDRSSRPGHEDAVSSPPSWSRGHAGKGCLASDIDQAPWLCFDGPSNDAQHDGIDGIASRKGGISDVVQILPSHLDVSTTYSHIAFASSEPVLDQAWKKEASCRGCYDICRTLETIKQEQQNRDDCSALVCYGLAKETCVDNKMEGFEFTDNSNDPQFDASELGQPLTSACVKGKQELGNGEQPKGFASREESENDVTKCLERTRSYKSDKELVSREGNGGRLWLEETSSGDTLSLVVDRDIHRLSFDSSDFYHSPQGTTLSLVDTSYIERPSEAGASQTGTDGIQLTSTLANDPNLAQVEEDHCVVKDLKDCLEESIPAYLEDEFSDIISNDQPILATGGLTGERDVGAMGQILTSKRRLVDEPCMIPINNLDAVSVVSFEEYAVVNFVSKLYESSLAYLEESDLKSRDVVTNDNSPAHDNDSKDADDNAWMGDDYKCHDLVYLDDSDDDDDDLRETDTSSSESGIVLREPLETIYESSDESSNEAGMETVRNDDAGQLATDADRTSQASPTIMDNLCETEPPTANSGNATAASEKWAEDNENQADLETESSDGYAGRPVVDDDKAFMSNPTSMDAFDEIECAANSSKATASEQDAKERQDGMEILNAVDNAAQPTTNAHSASQTYPTSTNILNETGRYPDSSNAAAFELDASSSRRIVNVPCLSDSIGGHARVDTQLRSISKEPFSSASVRNSSNSWHVPDDSASEFADATQIDLVTKDADATAIEVYHHEDSDTEDCESNDVNASNASHVVCVDRCCDDLNDTKSVTAEAAFSGQPALQVATTSTWCFDNLPVHHSTQPNKSTEATSPPGSRQHGDSLACDQDGSCLRSPGSFSDDLAWRSSSSVALRYLSRSTGDIISSISDMDGSRSFYLRDDDDFTDGLTAKTIRMSGRLSKSAEMIRRKPRIVLSSNYHKRPVRVTDLDELMKSLNNVAKSPLHDDSRWKGQSEIQRPQKVVKVSRRIIRISKSTTSLVAPTTDDAKRHELDVLGNENTADKRHSGTAGSKLQAPICGKQPQPIDSVLQCEETAQTHTNNLTDQSLPCQPEPGADGVLSISQDVSHNKSTARGGNGDAICDAAVYDVNKNVVPALMIDNGDSQTSLLSDDVCLDDVDRHRARSLTKPGKELAIGFALYGRSGANSHDFSTSRSLPSLLDEVGVGMSLGTKPRCLETSIDDILDTDLDNLEHQITDTHDTVVTDLDSALAASTHNLPVERALGSVESFGPSSDGMSSSSMLGSPRSERSTSAKAIRRIKTRQWPTVSPSSSTSIIGDHHDASDDSDVPLSPSRTQVRAGLVRAGSQPIEIKKHRAHYDVINASTDFMTGSHSPVQRSSLIRSLSSSSCRSEDQERLLLEQYRLGRQMHKKSRLSTSDADSDVFSDITDASVSLSSLTHDFRDNSPLTSSRDEIIAVRVSSSSIPIESPTPEPLKGFDLNAFDNDDLGHLMMAQAASAVRSRRAKRGKRLQFNAAGEPTEASDDVKHRHVITTADSPLTTSPPATHQTSEDHHNHVTSDVMRTHQQAHVGVSATLSEQSHGNRIQSPVRRHHSSSLENSSHEDAEKARVKTRIYSSSSIHSNRTIIQSMPDLRRHRSSRSAVYSDTDSIMSDDTGVMSDSLFFDPSIDLSLRRRSSSFRGSYVPRIPRLTEEQTSSDANDDDSVFSPRLSTDDGKVVKCANDHCQKQEIASDIQHTAFTSCTSCFTFYCSLACRKAHWEVHKKVCYLGRVTYYVKAMFRQFENLPMLSQHLSEFATRNYSKQGKGFVDVNFASPASAKFFLLSRSTSFPIDPEYVSMASLIDGAQQSTEVVRHNVQQCFFDNEYVINVTVVMDRRTETGSQGHSPGHHAVRQCRRLPLHSVHRRLLAASPSLTKLTASCETQVFTLPMVPPSDQVDDRNVRLFHCRQVSKGLQRCGIHLKSDYPNAYAKFCVYVEQNVTFHPVTLYGEVDGRQYKCIVYPEGHQGVLDLDEEAGGGVMV